MTTIAPLMRRRGTEGRTRTPAKPIALVCVSKHERGAAAKDPDKLTIVRDKWAWCPTGGAAGHRWQPVKAGSLNALRVQLVEVSRLVDVALSDRRAEKEPKMIDGPRSRGRKR